MSGVTYWLQRQRKSELANLAERAGLKEYVVLRQNPLPLPLLPWVFFPPPLPPPPPPSSFPLTNIPNNALNRIANQLLAPPPSGGGGKGGEDRSYEGLLKSELEVALEQHLRANETRLSSDPVLEPFYRRIGALSPIKRESGGGGGGALLTSGDEVKKQTRVRRQTRAKEEIEQP